MLQKIVVNHARFINAEPCIIPTEGNPPAVILSFGAEEGPIEDRIIGVNDAREMVTNLLESLATLGDPLAQAIGEQFFHNQSDEDYSDEYSDDDHFDC